MSRLVRSGHNPRPGPYLLGAPLDAAVLAGHVLAVPVVSSPTGETQVGVALPHGQVARALLGVALGLTAAAGESILTWVGQQARLGGRAG